MGSCARWAVGIALGVAACTRSTPPGPAATAEAHRARLIAVAGDVQIKRSTSNDYQAATKGAVLSIADLVATGASGHATIAFDDGSTAMVTPHSLVSIEPPAASAADGIQVQRGRVDVEIEASRAGEFRIRTPDADASLPARDIEVVGKK